MPILKQVPDARCTSGFREIVLTTWTEVLWDRSKPEAIKYHEIWELNPRTIKCLSGLGISSRQKA